MVSIAFGSCTVQTKYFDCQLGDRGFLDLDLPPCSRAQSKWELAAPGSTPTGRRCQGAQEGG